MILGAQTDQHITHSIDRPVEIVFEQTDEGEDVSLAVKTSDDVITILRFRAAVISDRVDDLMAHTTNKIITCSRVISRCTRFHTG
jgi:hypothetical protein